MPGDAEQQLALSKGTGFFLPKFQPGRSALRPTGSKPHTSLAGSSRDAVEDLEQRTAGDLSSSMLLQQQENGAAAACAAVRALTASRHTLHSVRRISSSNALSSSSSGSCAASRSSSSSPSLSPDPKSTAPIAAAAAAAKQATGHLRQQRQHISDLAAASTTAGASTAMVQSNQPLLEFAVAAAGAGAGVAAGSCSDLNNVHNAPHPHPSLCELRYEASWEDICKLFGECDAGCLPEPASAHGWAFSAAAAAAAESGSQPEGLGSDHQAAPALGGRPNSTTSSRIRSGSTNLSLQRAGSSSSWSSSSCRWAPSKPLMQQQQQQQPQTLPPPPPPRPHHQSPSATAATATATATATANAAAAAAFSPYSMNTASLSSSQPTLRSAPIPMLRPAVVAATASATDLASSLNSSFTHSLLLSSTAADAAAAVDVSLGHSDTSYLHRQIMQLSATEQHQVNTAANRDSASGLQLATAGLGCMDAAAAAAAGLGHSSSFDGCLQASPLPAYCCSWDDGEIRLAGCSLGQGSISSSISRSRFEKGMIVQGDTAVHGYAAQQLHQQQQQQQGALGKSNSNLAAATTAATVAVQQVAGGAAFGSNVALDVFDQQLLSPPLKQQQQQQVVMTASVFNKSMPLPMLHQFSQQHQNKQQLQQQSTWQQSISGSMTSMLLLDDEVQQHEANVIKAIDQELSQLMQIRQQVLASKAATAAAAKTRAAAAVAAADRVVGSSISAGTGSLDEQQMCYWPGSTGGTSIHITGSTGSTSMHRTGSTGSTSMHRTGSAGSTSMHIMSSTGRTGLYHSLAGVVDEVETRPGSYSCSTLDLFQHASEATTDAHNRSTVLLGPGGSGGSSVPQTYEPLMHY